MNNTLSVLCIAAAVLALGLAIASRFDRARDGSGALAGGASSRKRRNTIIFWSACVIVMIVGLVDFDALQVDRYLPALFVISGAAVLLWAVKRLLTWFRHYDRELVRILHRTDVESPEAVAAGIEAIESLINRRGPTGMRLNALGTMFISQKRWEDALARFREAEQIGDRHLGMFVFNQGIALMKLRREEEAVERMREGCRMLPDQFLLATQFCIALADLGRMEEARHELARVEQIYLGLARTRLGRSSDAIQLIAICRARVNAG